MPIIVSRALLNRTRRGLMAERRNWNVQFQWVRGGGERRKEEVEIGSACRNFHEVEFQEEIEKEAAKKFH